MKTGHRSKCCCFFIFILLAASQLQMPFIFSVPTAGCQSAEPEVYLAQQNPKPTGREAIAAEFEHAMGEVQPLLDHYGYLAVFGAVLVEGFGLVAPGQTLLMAAAFTAARGGLNLILVLGLAFTAAVLGNSLGYLLGARGGRPLLGKLRLKEERLQRLEGYFKRYGSGIVVAARFFDGLRQLNGIVAGLLHMPWKSFTICNILGAALWTGLWGLGTYALEKDIARIHLSLRQVEPLVAIVVLLGVLVALIYVLGPVRKTGVD